MILTAPHGGYSTHPGVQDREHGCYDNATDTCRFEGEAGCAAPEVKKCRYEARPCRRLCLFSAVPTILP